jgi:hypothetical protein
LRVSGFVITASEVRIVTLEGIRAAHTRIADKLHKLPIADGSSAESIKAVVAALNAHIRDVEVQRIGLISYSERGTFSASGAVYRIEGALMFVAEAEVRFVHKATLKATDRRHGELKTQRPETKALGEAYDLAFECLN